MKNRTAFVVTFLFMVAGLAGAQSSGYSSRDDLGMSVAVAEAGREASIAVAWGEQLAPASQYLRMIINLRDAMTKWTNIPTTIENHFRIGSTSLTNLQVLFITTDAQFELSAAEKENLKEYIANGGFIVVDDAAANIPNSQSNASLRQMIRDIAGGKHLEPVPDNHPIYSTPFLLGGPPLGSDSEMGKVGERKLTDGTMVDIMVNANNAPMLEGVFIDGRLAILYSPKGYTAKWNDESNDAHLKFGVNLIMYAMENQ